MNKWTRTGIRLQTFPSTPKKRFTTIQMVWVYVLGFMTGLAAIIYPLAFR